MLKRAVVCLAALSVLAGCGSSTSEAPDDTKVESLHREQSTDDKDAGKDKDRSKDGKSSEPSSPSEEAPADQSAREIESIPGAEPGDPKEVEFFEELKGIDVEGVEDQLVATAQEVCSDGRDSVLLNAVAGQLDQQDRSDLNVEQLADRIAEAAEKAYC
ncbi:hypothetical protein CCICO_00925 [Corynebacterium ciconiae DSM 44920]|uniref:hypothetical protein n=1 Tax=Corynebacterium ciconiae TaxID=227319 RepID=UPI00036FAE41|nr:hypothetical protein [Corynebacterium ciconiae]WKD60243.1 hypothetical protein CCICO_00925 [Corynebacterium ciconiae DSM 44920]